MDPICCVAAVLLLHGKSVGAFQPWHLTEDTYQWLVAELLLRRTTRTAAAKAFEDTLRAFPSWQNLNEASEVDLYSTISWIGLGNQRTKQLKALAGAVTAEHNGVVPLIRQTLLSLPGVGNYIADAILLHTGSERTLPIDPNIQRVLRRIFGLPTSRGGTRHSDPYKDLVVPSISKTLCSLYRPSNLRHIHLGLLSIAWEHCRPKPRCSSCPLNPECIESQLALSPSLTMVGRGPMIHKPDACECTVEPATRVSISRSLSQSQLPPTKLWPVLVNRAICPVGGLCSIA
jgi:A/G-specific adenine glycosylase